MKQLLMLPFVVTVVACSDDAALPMSHEIVTENGVAVRGYDVVSYFTADGPVLGSTDLSTEWQNATWHFSSQENLESFVAAPEKFAPQFGGHCALAVSFGDLVPGSAETWSITEGKLYLNANGFAQFLWGLLPGRRESAEAAWAAAPP